MTDDDDPITAAEVEAAEAMLRWTTGAHGNQLLGGRCPEHSWSSRKRTVNGQYSDQFDTRWLTIEDTVRHLRKKHRP
jgi:hypothetical protein